MQYEQTAGPVSGAPAAHQGPSGTTDVAAARHAEGPGLRRALAAAIDVMIIELGRSDPALAARLRPMLAGLAGSASA